MWPLTRGAKPSDRQAARAGLSVRRSRHPRYMSSRDTVVPIGRVAPGDGRSLDGLPGSVRRRGEVPAPAAYAVVDCETTGTDPAVDEIVSLAIVRLDARRCRDRPLRQPGAALVPDPARGDGRARDRRRGRRAGAVLRADRARGARRFSTTPCSWRTMPPSTSACCSTPSHEPAADYRPAGVACTLDAFRLLEPREPSHRLESICERRGITLGSAHEALGDVVATAALLRVLLDEGLAPETVQLDHLAYMRLRSRGDTRPASEPQVRRVFGLARCRRPALPGRERRPRPGRRARRAGRGHDRRRLPHARAGAGRLRRARAPDRAADGDRPGRDRVAHEQAH